MIPIKIADSLKQMLAELGRADELAGFISHAFNFRETKSYLWRLSAHEQPCLSTREQRRREENREQAEHVNGWMDNSDDDAEMRFFSRKKTLYHGK